MFSIHDFFKIKDHLPIIYLGHSELSAAKLVIIIGNLREKLKKQFFLVFKKEISKNFKYDFIISQEEYAKISQHFLRSCVCGENGNKTIETFLKENCLDKLIDEKSKSRGNKKYYLGKDAEFIEDFKGKTKDIILTENIEDCVKDANLVYGRESTGLLALAYQKIPITLFQNKADNSFQMIFPNINLYRY